tara:strand:+ start:595 stop:1038 length:444 start_codon:yes stop_codon:yes gene_type:complete
MITEITKQLINWTNDLEELVASEIKANNANPNQAGFTSIADAFAISVYNCLGFSAEYHRGKQKENNNLAEMNHKKAGSAMRFGENEHREKVIADTLIELQAEWRKLCKEAGLAISWAELKGESKAVQIPLSDINKMREQQGLPPIGS